MAYDCASASSQYLSTASTPVTGPPVTLAIWFYPKATGAIYFELQQNGGADNRDRLRLLQSGSNMAANSISETPFVDASSTSSNTFTRQAWNHTAGVFTSNSSRLVYLNGVAGTTNTTTVNCRSMTKININAIQFTFGSNIAYGNTIYAEAGIWNVALTAAEIASLANGVACRLIRPQSLVFYAPLIRDLVDLRASRTITNNGSAVASDHPRIYA